MNKPHVHAELIKQWADGAVIEVYYLQDRRWRVVRSPSWYSGNEYRVKPEPREYWIIASNENDQVSIYLNHDEAKTYIKGYESTCSIVHVREVMEDE